MVRPHITQYPEAGARKLLLILHENEYQIVMERSLLA